MSEEDNYKLSKILYYSDIHPADTEFINNIIYNLIEENEELKQKIELITENIRELLHKIDDLQKQK